MIFLPFLKFICVANLNYINRKKDEQKGKNYANQSSVTHKIFLRPSSNKNHIG